MGGFKQKVISSKLFIKGIGLTVPILLEGSVCDHGPQNIIISHKGKFIEIEIYTSSES